MVTISSIWHFVGIGRFFIWPCQSSSGISLCPSGPGWCHQEWMWSRYHTGLSVPCQMQLCHPWHHLNLLKFNGSCTSGLNHLALQRVFACINDFGSDEMDNLSSAKYALSIFTFILWHLIRGLLHHKMCLWAFSGVSHCWFWYICQPFSTYPSFSTG